MEAIIILSTMVFTLIPFLVLFAVYFGFIALIVWFAVAFIKSQKERNEILTSINNNLKMNASANEAGPQNDKPDADVSNQNEPEQTTGDVEAYDRNEQLSEDDLEEDFNKMTEEALEDMKDQQDKL